MKMSCKGIKKESCIPLILIGDYTTDIENNKAEFAILH